MKSRRIFISFNYTTGYSSQSAGRCQCPLSEIFASLTQERQPTITEHKDLFRHIYRPKGLQLLATCQVCNFAVRRRQIYLIERVYLIELYINVQDCEKS